MVRDKKSLNTRYAARIVPNIFCITLFRKVWGLEFMIQYHVTIHQKCQEMYKFQEGPCPGLKVQKRHSRVALHEQRWQEPLWSLSLFKHWPRITEHLVARQCATYVTSHFAQSKLILQKQYWPSSLPPIRQRNSQDPESLLDSSESTVRAMLKGAARQFP